jgi:hypothetical protein
MTHHSQDNILDNVRELLNMAAIFVHNEHILGHAVA